MILTKQTPSKVAYLKKLNWNFENVPGTFETFMGKLKTKCSSYDKAVEWLNWPLEFVLRDDSLYLIKISW